MIALQGKGGLKNVLRKSPSIALTDTEPAGGTLNSSNGACGRVPRERRGGRHPVQQGPRLSAR